MRRRDFITFVGGTAAAWPLAVHAQQGPVPVLGYLSALTERADRTALAGYRRGLDEQRYVDGRAMSKFYIAMQAGNSIAFRVSSKNWSTNASL